MFAPEVHLEMVFPAVSRLDVLPDSGPLFLDGFHRVYAVKAHITCRNLSWKGWKPLKTKSRGGPYKTVSCPHSSNG